MRVLITGSRDWVDYGVVRDALDLVWEIRENDESFVLVHGGCRYGADAYANGWARQRLQQGDPIQIEIHLADWEMNGRSAGHIRNAEMVKAGADRFIAFIRNDSPGARGCLKLANNAGIPVITVYREQGA